MNQQTQMIGTITEFNSRNDDWNVYYERLEQFFEVNDIADQKRSAFLISVIGSDAYKSLRDLCHPVLPKDKPFDFLCELLRKQFSPQVSIFRERAKFYNIRQEVHENVTQWYGKLKRLSVDCKFGENLGAVLLDKFITGLRPGQVLDRLCEENESLKLEQALDIAVNKECAAKDNAYAPAKPYRPPGGCFPPPISSPCLFGGQPLKQLAPTRCFAPPAEGYKLQATGLDGGSCFGAPASGLKSQAIGLGGGSIFATPAVGFGGASAGFGAPVGGFGAANKLQLEQTQALPLESAPCALESSAPEVEADGLPEGANRADCAQARGRGGRIRTRRRGAARRGAAGDNADKHSVDGEH